MLSALTWTASRVGCANAGFAINYSWLVQVHSAVFRALVLNKSGLGMANQAAERTVVLNSINAVQHGYCGQGRRRVGASPVTLFVASLHDLN